MWKQFTHNGNYKIILLHLVLNYNARIELLVCVPSTLPCDRRQAILTTIYNHVKIAIRIRYKVGDSVRVIKFKTVFDKGHAELEQEAFKIIKVQQTNPVTNLLEDSRGKPIAEGIRIA
ncbi:PREDICTED: uncharacterized protein LOC108690203 [Atta colombica]|uniref:uncharacterized protein LOC108690203 n=1 Tax=Atta colombica TaxID=520822 RepID=UPI00084C55D1|nr:PREDICTED: uncharacterized protein LOC108690203 [Atta colombica]